MNPEQLGVGVAHKRALTAHVLGRDLNRLADAEMAGLAAVHHASVRNVDLLDGDVHGPSLVHQTLDLLRREAVQVLLKVGILLGPKLRNGMKNLALPHQQLAFLRLQRLEFAFQIVVVDALCLALAVVQ